MHLKYKYCCQFGTMLAIICFLLFFQEAALKTFHISDDPKNYYVAEASEYGKCCVRILYYRTCVLFVTVYL